MLLLLRIYTVSRIIALGLHDREQLFIVKSSSAAADEDDFVYPYHQCGAYFLVMWLPFKTGFNNLITNSRKVTSTKLPLALEGSCALV